MTRFHLRDGEHGGVDGPLVARDDALQARPDLQRGEDGIDAIVRNRGMRAHAFDADLELVARCLRRAHARAEVARGHAGPVVQREHGIDGKLPEEAIVDHCLRAAAAFFRRLEDEDHGAVEVAMLRQIARRAEQHRGVAVVPAGVHLVLVLRRVRERVEFGNRQRVHIRPQAYRALARALSQHADHACLAEPARHFDVPAFELARDEIGGARFFVAKLGMRVDVAADGLEFVLRLGDLGNDRHAVLLRRMKNTALSAAVIHRKADISCP